MKQIIEGIDIEILETLEERYNCKPFILLDLLEYLTETYGNLEDTQIQSYTQTEETLPPLDDDVIIVNEEYVQTLIDNIKNIEDIDLGYEIGKLENGLKSVLKGGDFDDPEEIICKIHGLISKYVYKSDTKVSPSDWDKLEKYIKDAGYTAVPIKAGDSITPYRTYFDRPIPVDDPRKKPFTIKQVQLAPYILKYYDDGEITQLKLAGKCTYYK